MDRYVTHATFTLERSYPVPPARVFAAWADPVAKARWFTPGPGTGHELDFRIGGREVARGGPDGGPVMTFESLYRDIVPDERIVYTSTLAEGDDLVTVSLTTVEFIPAEAGTGPGTGTGPGAGTRPGGDTGPGGSAGPGGGTRLVLTEQGAFLDGREQPAWREQGTADQLTALARELTRDPA
jgi:uncharacterized protein YndB with AHSA1/START domain